MECKVTFRAKHALMTQENIDALGKEAERYDGFAFDKQLYRIAATTIKDQ